MLIERLIDSLKLLLNVRTVREQNVSFALSSSEKSEQNALLNFDINWRFIVFMRVSVFFPTFSLFYASYLD